MKKNLCILMGLIFLLASLFSGCKETDTNNDTTTTTNNTTAATTKTQETTTQMTTTSTEKAEEIDYFMKFEPSITISKGTKLTSPETSFLPGDDIENNELTRWSEEKIGIVWKASFTAPDDATIRTKLNLAMASNEIPDMIGSADPQLIMMLAKNGQIIPLDDLIEKWASPLTKYLFEEWDSVFNGLWLAPWTYEGKVYSIPRMNDNVSPPYPVYRKDILDELALSVPTTIYELEYALKSYKEKYPDGVGLIMDKTLANGFYMIMNAYGAFPNFWVDDGNGNAVFGSIQPEVEEALAILNKWYKAGYLDEEFFLKDGVKSGESSASGNAFCFEGSWYHMGYLYNPFAAHKLDEKVEVVAGPYLKGPNGDIAARQHNNNSGGTGYAISSEFENPEALIIYMNWQADSAYRNSSDLRAKFDFIHESEDEQIPKNTDEITAAQEAKASVIPWKLYDYIDPGPGNGNVSYFNSEFHMARDYFGFNFIQRPDQLLNMFLKGAEAFKTGDASNLSVSEKALFDSQFKGFESIRKAHYEAMELVITQKEYVKSDMFSGAPTPGMTENMTYLKKIQDETFTRIIIGDAPIEEFDTFVESWNSSGGEQITKEVNDWLKTIR